MLGSTQLNHYILSFKKGLIMVLYKRLWRLLRSLERILWCMLSFRLLNLVFGICKYFIRLTIGKIVPWRRIGGSESRWFENWWSNIILIEGIFELPQQARVQDTRMVMLQLKKTDSVLPKMRRSCWVIEWEARKPNWWVEGKSLKREYIHLKRKSLSIFLKMDDSLIS